jgi:SNF2 family DNA or RNA helicase
MKSMPDLYLFQVAGRDFLATRRRAILADPMGLGKTPQALTAAAKLQARTVVVICPTFAITTWENEIQTWAPPLVGNVAVVTGEAKARAAGWEQWGALTAAPRCLISTYRHLPEVAERLGEVDLAIFDECHLISNRKTKAFKAAKRLRSRHLFMLSGTPTRKCPSELWNYLHLIDKRRFSSFWRWAGEHFMVGEGYAIEGLSHPAAFRSHLQPYLLRRVKSEVLTELPPLTRQRVFLPLEPETQVAYDRLCDELMLEWGDGLLTVPNPLTLLTRLRQLTVCPAVLGLDLPSAPLNATVERVEALMGEGRKAVVFCPFRAALPFIARHFEGWRVFFVHGDQDRLTNAAEIDAFQKISRPAVMLATTGMGASWSANTADSCFFLGFSWSPIENQQCEGRLHRHGQRSVVNAYYMGGKGTVDEVIADVIEGKVRLADLALKSALKGGCVEAPKPVECLTI